MTKKQDEGYNFNEYLEQLRDICESEIVLTQEVIEGLFDIVDEDSGIVCKQICRFSDSLEDILYQDIPEVFELLNNEVDFSTPVDSDSVFADAQSKVFNLYQDFQETCLDIKEYIREELPKLDTEFTNDSDIVAALLELTNMVVSLSQKVVAAKNAIEKAVESIKLDKEKSKIQAERAARNKKAMEDYYTQKALEEEQAIKQAELDRQRQAEEEAEAQRLDILSQENDLRLKMLVLEEKKKALLEKNLRRS